MSDDPKRHGDLLRGSLPASETRAKTFDARPVPPWSWGAQLAPGVQVANMPSTAGVPKNTRRP